MTILELPAARARQGSLTLYTTSIKVRDLVVPDFYSVEALDPADHNDRGYQRLLNAGRARRLADYMVDGQEAKDAFLPTSIFLATAKALAFDDTRNILRIDTVATGPFAVVDGQHRCEGLRLAAERDARVLDFEIPVNIAVELSQLAQTCHFLIVNTTQKSVDASVEQRIMARLTAAALVEDVPTLPKWIRKTVERGEADKGTKYVDFLNSAPDSPWLGKILMANQADKEDTTVKQNSFVKAITKYVLTANNPLAATVADFDTEKRVFLNYWRAIAEVIDDGGADVLYKYNGVELFCRFSIPFFTKLADKGKFSVAAMVPLLRATFENVEGEYIGVGHPDFWRSGGKASGINSGAINTLYQNLTTALHKAGGQTATIEI